MPIYEYVCRNCGEELEQLQRLSDDALTDCPACGESALKRKISAAGFRLAGGGWYETDFKSDGKRNLAGSDDKSKAASSTAANGDSKSTDSTPAKPAAKESSAASPKSTAGTDKSSSKKKPDSGKSSSSSAS